jgi:alpha-beta hydrolase superfamily lysophospholipase
MTEEERSKIKWRFKSQDGLELFTHAFPANEDPKAVVCIVHGHGEHIERYEHAAQAFNQVGYSVIGYDQRGHGQSQGSRGHVPSYELLLDDLSRFRKEVKEYYPNLPHFIWGHSMGGNIVLNYVLRQNPGTTGVIATGPWLKLAFEPPAVQMFLGRMMNKIKPDFTQESGLDTSALSHDPEVVRAYEEDSLVHGKVSARLMVEMMDAGTWALEHAAEFPARLLLMHGSEDRITSSAASKDFAAKAPSDKVTLKIWDGFYHELHNEPEKAEVLNTIIEWMDSRLA